MPMLKITYYIFCVLFATSVAYSATNVEDVYKTDTTNNEILNFSLYPNPTKEKVEITFDKPINTIINVYDNLGNNVFDIPTENKNKIIMNFKELAAGIYFVCVKTEEKTIIKRLIKY